MNKAIVVSNLLNNNVLFVIENLNSEITVEKIAEYCKKFYESLYTNVDVEIQGIGSKFPQIMVTFSQEDEPFFLDWSWKKSFKA